MGKREKEKKQLGKIPAYNKENHRIPAYDEFTFFCGQKIERHKNRELSTYVRRGEGKRKKKYGTSIIFIFADQTTTTKKKKEKCTVVPRAKVANAFAKDWQFSFYSKLLKEFHKGRIVWKKRARSNPLGVSWLSF